MTEKPIIFDDAMVRAILDGRKTQTRRVAKLNDSGRVSRGGRQWHVDDPDAVQACPYGGPGDRLWVREACKAHEQNDGLDGVLYRADHAFRPIENTWEASDQWVALNHYRFGKRGGTVRAQHMPRWASRITLEITDVRVERLQEITEADAVAEGVGSRLPDCGIAQDEYCDLWDSLNAKRGHGWETNPWVWSIAFRRMSNDV